MIALRVIDEPVEKVLLPTSIPGQHRHGFSQTPTYTAWNAMMGRCRNPRHKDYPRFGGKGVTVCFRWLSFKGFLADMGPLPIDRYGLVRLDDDKGFEPGNCAWR